tara:strand:+ start:126 stop:857 length:732 start_codon:yes stop_codon:yes gene_type:complete
MLLNFRIFIISFLIYLLDLVTFYPRLKKIILLNLGNTPKLVLDVGGNKGQTISFFLNLNKHAKIVSFEPTKSLHEYLIKKYNSFSNVTISNKGISSFSGEKKFYENHLNLTSSFEKLNYYSDYLKFKTKILGIDKNKIIKKEYNVKVITLSSYINDILKSDIDIIKIDVEGHEYECLKGLFNTPLNLNIHLIQLEHHNDDMYENSISFNQINDILNENNFELIERLNHAFGDFEDLLYKNKML